MISDEPICVTGASGFIAAHVVRELLARGYRVRGTVRDPGADKYDFLRSLPGAEERLELVKAELLDAGSYDGALAGCEYVIHTASPYVVDVKDAQTDLVDPAVNGTLNVMRAAQRAGTIKRVVLTSSMAAISDEPDDDKVFSEDDWNRKSTLKRNPYYLSKTLAEKSAWDFVEAEEPGFDLVTINPYMTIGPSLGPGLNTSNQVFRDILSGVFPGVMNLSWGFVDVRDVARAHVLAMETPAASGRYLCSHESRTMKEIVQLLKDAGYGDYKLPRFDLACNAGDFMVRLMSYTQPTGVGSFLRSHVGKVMKFDNGKIQRDLGIAFMPVDESIKEAVEDMLRWHHLEPPGTRRA